MPNLFVNLPVPSSNAAGAAVDVSRMGATKTITVGGPFDATVTIEYATDDTGSRWAPVPNGSFVGNPGRVTFDVAAHFMRAVTSAYKGGTPNADVGSSGAGSSFVQLGVGAVDVSALPRLKTVVVSGACNVEISEDGVTWSQAFSFQQAGGQTGIVYAQFARVTNGASAWMGGAEEGEGEGSPAFALSTTIIYARPVSQGGSDTSGNGTLAAPYLTFQRAIRDVPNTPAPGPRYIVDITGIGVEPLPDQYTLPSIRFPTMTYGNDTTSFPFFYSGTGLRIRAIPQLVAAIPSAEAVIDAGAAATIAANPDTNLITLTIPSQRTSWTTANLKNKQLIRTIGTFKAGCAIKSASNAPGTSSLVLCNDADNFNGGAVGPVVLAPGEVLQIVEASATLEGGVSPDMDYNNGYGFAAIQTRINSIALQGIKITSRVAGSTAIAILDCPMTDIELCDIAGINGQGYAGTYWMIANGSVIRSNLLAVNCSFFTHACHLDTIDFFYMANATPQSFSSSILTDCAQYASPEITGLPIVSNTAFANVLMDNSGAVVDHGGGISVTQGHLSLDHVQINDVTGNAIEVLQGSFAVLNRVTGTGNVGQGVLASDGSQVQADETTTIGDDGPRAYTNGTAPGTPIVVGTWPAAPDNSVNATTFSRVFVPA